MSKQIKNILITFDYELYLGKRSGNADDCLIKPTNYLLNILKKCNLKAIFFVDTTYLLKLKKQAETHSLAKSDWTKIIHQLETILRDAHYVFPHIHPHWIDAKYIESSNEWDLSDSSKYRFENIPTNERSLLFLDSISLLESIIKPIVPDYKIDSYRAGGYCIQPFEVFEPLFQKHGIKNDFSVIPGLYNRSDVHRFDFRSISESIYSFEQAIEKTQEGGIYKEYPISSVYISQIQNKVNHYLGLFFLLLQLKPIGKGSFVDVSNLEVIDTFSNPNLIRKTSSFDNFNFITAGAHKKKLKNSSYLHFVSHPKLLSKANMFFIRNFLKYISIKYTVISNYTNIN